MKISYLLLFALSLLLFLPCCTGTTNLSGTEFIIAGGWNWVKSEGWPGSTTPEQAGYTKQIFFDMAGTYYEYRNDSIYLKSGYRIVEKDIDDDKFIEQIIVIDDLPEEYIVKSFQNDTLLLKIIDCADCRNKEYYTKIK